MKLLNPNIFQALISTGILVFSSPGNSKAEPAVIIRDSVLFGRFINYTVLNTITDKLPEQIPAYCFELNFVSSDSVEVFGGFEEYKLSYKKQGNQYVLIGASFKGNMSFTINGSIITLDDKAWTGAATPSEFRRVDESKSNKKWLFDNYLNERIIAGEYQLLKKGETKDIKVVFMPDGSVTGFLKYTRYDICYSGDCIETSSEPSYIITLYGPDITEDYAFTINKKSGEINLYVLAPPIENIKGDRPIKDKIFTLKKL